MRKRIISIFVLFIFILFTIAPVYFNLVHIRPVEAADSYHEYFSSISYVYLDTDGDAKNNAIKVTMNADSNYSGSTQVRALVVLRDPSNNNCASNSTTWNIEDAHVEWASVIVYVPSDRGEGWYDVIPILYDALDNFQDQKVEDNLAYLYPTIPPGGYSVQIWAWCPDGWLDGVPITKDGVVTNLSTPNTFAVTGTHTFTVPSTYGGKTFGSWNTGETSTTLAVSSGGQYTAVYDAYNVIIEAYDPLGGVWTPISMPITMDGSSTGFSTPHTFTLSGTHSFSLPNINDANGYPFYGWIYGPSPMTVAPNPRIVSSGGRTVALYMQPITVSITPSSWVMDAGQSKTLSSSASGGLGPYSVKWMSALGGASETYTFNFESFAGGEGIYFVRFYVEMATPFAGSVIQTYATADVTVNHALSTPSASASAGTIDRGQSSTLSVTGLSGGTVPYAYQWLVKAPGAGSYSAIIGATSNTYIFSTSALTSLGSWSFQLQVTDNASSPVSVISSSASVTVTAATDTTPPTGSIVINGGAATTSSVSVSLTLSATDLESGVSQMRFSNDASSWSAWEAYATSKSWSTTSGDGLKTVYVQFRNGAGLDSISYSDSITLQSPADTTPPTGSVTINGGAASTSSASVTLTLAATDAESGVAQMRFSNDGASWSTWEPYATSKGWTLSSGDGTKTVYAQFKNGAGLDSVSYSDTITLQPPADTTPPTGSVIINGNAATTNTVSVVLTLSATDPESGVAQMRFSNDGSAWSNWETYSASKSWTLTSGDGAKTVYVQFKNGAGLDSISYSDSITLQSTSADTTPPTGSVTINGGAASTNSVSVTLTLVATDNSGVVAQMRFANLGESWTAWEPYATSKVWTLTSGMGEKTVLAQFKDGSGIESAPYGDTIVFDPSFEEKTFNVTVGTSTYTVISRSNSSVSDFSFNQALKRIRFSVNGTAGTTGFCNITTPAALISGDFSLFMDDVQLVKDTGYTQTSNGTHYSFSINHGSGVHVVEIFGTNVVPEFPASAALMLSIVVASSLASGFRRKLKRA